MEFLTSGFNILLILVGFGVLIFVHELGHFVAAKWAGIRTEAFAVGMGPAALAWRKGIGLRFGSTAAEYERKVREHLDSQAPNYSQSASPDPAAALPHAEMYKIGDTIGLGETEYSLRWLPLGGFVKMLGQEDANPNYVSNDPRSYSRCPVGKRMIVVSAGVIMNIILAVVLFVIAFMVGVKFEAAVVGDVSPRMPAGLTMADNAKSLGIETPGLQAGDEVISIEGKPARTFADLQIGAAMSKPGEPLKVEVRRDGVTEPLHFTLLPQKDTVTGLLGIGVYPGASTTLISKDEQDVIARTLRRSGAAEAGVQLGMTLVSVNDRSINTYGQLTQAADASRGEPLETVWAHLDEQRNPIGGSIAFEMDVSPDYMEYRRPDAFSDSGLIGLSPLVRIFHVEEDSQNKKLLQAGDVIVKVGSISYPRLSQFIDTVKANRKSNLPIVVLRNGSEVTVDAIVNGDGQLKVLPEYAKHTLITAQPIESYSRYRTDDPKEIEEVSTPIKAANLFATGGTRIVAVNGNAINTWPELRTALREATSAGLESNEPVDVRLSIAHPVHGQHPAEVTVSVHVDEIKQLHALGWNIELPSAIFESIQTTLTAGGSPVRAVSMGFGETKKLVLMTYLTIDRLVRGSVGVDQLRGPVGIIHIGSKVADRGFMYIIFFLGMISVNLAVINFLPMPIVDGGLFLFLVYEKFKGRPPSIAFQNAATMAGICLIGALFLVTFYNDVLRLVS